VSHYKEGNLPAFCHKVTPGEPAKTDPGVWPRKSTKLVAVFESEELGKRTIPSKHGAAATLPGRGNAGTAGFGDEKFISVAKLPIWGDPSRGVNAAGSNATQSV
jgi:hypothetical protein